MNDADLEYGPTPPESEYEHTDIEPSIANRFAVWLALSLVLSAVIVYGTFWLLEGREKASGEATMQFPMAVGQVREPPQPRLQTRPFNDLYLMRETERQRLESYGWVDQSSGVVHMPIEDAMRMMMERGSVPAAAETPAGLNQLMQDSSSGRTAAPRY